MDREEYFEERLMAGEGLDDIALDMSYRELVELLPSLRVTRLLLAAADGPELGEFEQGRMFERILQRVRASGGASTS